MAVLFRLSCLLRFVGALGIYILPRLKLNTIIDTTDLVLINFSEVNNSLVTFGSDVGT